MSGSWSETVSPRGSLWEHWGRRTAPHPPKREPAEQAARSSQRPRQEEGEEGHQDPEAQKEGPLHPRLGLGEQGCAQVTIQGLQNGSEQGMGDVLMEQRTGSYEKSSWNRTHIHGVSLSSKQKAFRFYHM